MRRILTQFFVMQMEAEKSTKSLTQLIDNLPDAVLMLEKNRIIYCNQQANSFFGDSLLRCPAEDHLLLDNRCMHELNTSGAATAAEKMETVEDDNSIVETDLG